MGKNTVKLYRTIKTEKLQNLLKSLETAQFNTEYIIGEVKKSGEDVTKLEQNMVDYEIDISLIRMELNKRLWKEADVTAV